MLQLWQVCDLMVTSNSTVIHLTTGQCIVYYSQNWKYIINVCVSSLHTSRRKKQIINAQICWVTTQAACLSVVISVPMWYSAAINQKSIHSLIGILFNHAQIKCWRRTSIEHPDFTLEATQWPIHNPISFLFFIAFGFKLLQEFFQISLRLQLRSPCSETALCERFYEKLWDVNKSPFATFTLNIYDNMRSTEAAVWTSSICVK